MVIVAMTAGFHRSSQVAGWLLVPYREWGRFATVVNFTIWQINRCNSPLGGGFGIMDRTIGQNDDSNHWTRDR
jgi:hypothetical protein